MTGVELFTIAGTAVSLADALVVVGTTIGAAGAISSAQSSANAAEFNAKQAAIEAKQEQDLARAEAEDFRRRNSRILAASRARRAGSGVTGQGTPLLTDEATAGEIELGAQTILAGGQNRARTLNAEAELERSKAKSARTSGYLSAGTTLLTGAGAAFG